MSLNLSYLEHVTSAVVAAAASCCPALRELRLAACVRIDDTALFAIARGCGAAGSSDGIGLKVLDLHMDDKVTDEGLQAVAAACPGDLSHRPTNEPVCEYVNPSILSSMDHAPQTAPPTVRLLAR